MCFNCYKKTKIKKKTKRKKTKTNKKKRLVLVSSPTDFFEDDVQILIPEIVVHTVNEYK